MSFERTTALYMWKPMTRWNTKFSVDNHSQHIYLCHLKNRSIVPFLCNLISYMIYCLQINFVVNMQICDVI